MTKLNILSDRARRAESKKYIPSGVPLEFSRNSQSLKNEGFCQKLLLNWGSTQTMHGENSKGTPEGKCLYFFDSAWRALSDGLFSLVMKNLLVVENFSLRQWRALFCRGTFLHDFQRFLGAKKDTHGFQKKKWRKFRIFSFLFGSFFYIREKYLLIFVCTFKFSMF